MRILNLQGCKWSYKIIIITGKYDALIKEYIQWFTDEYTFNNLIFVNQQVPKGTCAAIKTGIKLFWRIIKSINS